MKAKLITGGLLAATLVLGACAQSPDLGQPDPTPKPQVHTEDEWEITTPPGWTSSDATDATDAEKAVRYEAPNGDFFIVAIDPLGSDFIYDALWRYEIGDDRFTVVDRYECAGTDDESCSDDDERFDGYILWEQGSDPEVVGGHTWYFIFGNDGETSVDTDTITEIVESIRVL